MLKCSQYILLNVNMSLSAETVSRRLPHQTEIC